MSRLVNTANTKNTAIKRRKFLSGTVGAAGATVAAGTLSTPAIAFGNRELKMVTTWPKNFPGLGTGAQRLADTITAMTDGELTVKLYAAGELVPAFECFDAVSGGSADLYHGADYYWQGKSKAYNFFAAVPFGLTADEMNAWLMWGGGQQLWDKLGAGFGLKHLPAGNTGVQMAGWFNKEINSLEDYKGLKMRMPGLGGEVLRRIGAAAVALPGGEIFPSLQSGAIDATEWVGPWNDLAFGFYKITKYYYYPGFHEPGTALCCGINAKVWDSLTPSQQAVITAATHAENSRMLAEFNAKNGDSLDVLINDHGVELRKVNDGVLLGIGEAASSVMAEVGQSDDITAEVYKSFREFRRKILRWTALSETAYTKARNLPFDY